MIKIDRNTSPFWQTNLEQYVTSEGWRFESHDEYSLQLESISPGDIQLKDLVHGSDPKLWNFEISNGLQALKDDGYILLDAQVLSSLMKSQSLPNEWVKIADTDHHSDEIIGEGTIRFDGSVITQSNDPLFRKILRPMIVRDQWILGATDVLFPEEDIRIFASQSPLPSAKNFRMRTAVIRMPR